MKNFDSFSTNHSGSSMNGPVQPKYSFGEPTPHPIYGEQSKNKSGRKEQYEKLLADRIEAGQTLVTELLSRFSPGTTLADLGEPGICVEQRLEELKAERGHGGGDSIAKLARLIIAIKRIELPPLH